MSNKDKVLTLEQMASKAETMRQSGKTIALCHGTFDLLHIGHIRHLEHAEKEADVLFVTITADEHVNKGPGRPVFSAQLRAEHLAALASVKYVAINYEPTAVNVLNWVKPDVYVKGNDYKDNEEDVTGNITLEKNAAEAHGGRIVYTDDLTFSSSKLLNDHFEVFAPETKQYLSNFKRKYSLNDVIGSIKSVSDLNVLVIGDAIVDEYHYTHPLGQTGKYNVLSVKYRDKERFAGGSIAVANHCAGFTKDVTLFTGLGEIHSHEEFIRSKMKENIESEFFYFSNSPTLVKRRYVDEDNCKLFEVYFYEDMPVQKDLNQKACQWLDKHIQDFDVVVVPDFGNGFITDEMVAVISEKARFLAVNTQLNSGNRGYHVISRYPRADFISLNEPELRIAAHNRHGDLEEIAEEVGARLDAKYIAITRGKLGIEMFDRDSAHRYQVPALSTKVVDRIGAGDAFLSIAGILLGGNVDARLAAFVGSAASALDVQIVCNRESVESPALFKYVTTLMK